MTVSPARAVATANNIAPTAKQIILFALILIPFRSAQDSRSSEFLTEGNEENKGLRDPN
jgi:hypothetical protein